MRARPGTATFDQRRCSSLGISWWNPPRPAVPHDRDLVHWSAFGTSRRPRRGRPRVGRDPPSLPRSAPTAAARTERDPLGRGLEIGGRDLRSALSRGQQRGLVQQVGQIRAREPGVSPATVTGPHPRRAQAARVDGQDRDSPGQVGQVDHLPAGRHRPGRSSAGSRTSVRLVAARTIT